MYQNADRQPRLFVDVDADLGALPLIPASGCRTKSTEGRLQGDMRPFVLNLQWVWLSARPGSIEAARRLQEIGGEAQMPDSIAVTLACF